MSCGSVNVHFYLERETNYTTIDCRCDLWDWFPCMGIAVIPILTHVIYDSHSHTWFYFLPIPSGIPYPWTSLFHTNINSQMWPMSQGTLVKSRCKISSVTNDLSHKITVQRCLRAVATSNSVRRQMLLAEKAMHYIARHLCCTLCSPLSCIDCILHLLQTLKLNLALVVSNNDKISVCWLNLMKLTNSRLIDWRIYQAYWLRTVITCNAFKWMLSFFWYSLTGVVM